MKAGKKIRARVKGNVVAGGIAGLITFGFTGSLDAGIESFGESFDPFCPSTNMVGPHHVAGECELTYICVEFREDVSYKQVFGAFSDGSTVRHVEANRKVNTYRDPIEVTEVLGTTTVTTETYSCREAAYSLGVKRELLSRGFYNASGSEGYERIKACGWVVTGGNGGAHTFE